VPLAHALERLPGCGVGLLLSSMVVNDLNVVGGRRS
jgi:hypothetical protein